jgi:hypothetical protein
VPRRKQLYSTKAAAALLGIAHQTAKLHCLRYNIGYLQTPRLRLLTEADLEQLRGHVRVKEGSK